MQVPDATEQRRHTYEIDVFRQILDPGVEGRFELIAVGAAVPEQLHHFDLTGLGHRHRALQLNVLLASHRLGVSGDTKQTADGQSRAENQVTHGVLLGSRHRLVANR